MTIRLAGILIGLAITAVLVLWSLVPGVINYSAPEHPAYYVFKEEPRAPEGGFSFDGPFGNWDYAQLQRGYAVYKQVCSACHGLKYVAFRNLQELGYSEAQARAEAATWNVPGVDPNTGEATTRPAELTDYFPSPYPNNVAAAAANNNAIPPDLSLMTKARPDGTNYVYSLLSGYVDPDPEKLAAAQEEGFEIPTGLYFNPWFPNVNLAMPPQLYPDLVTYDDGTEATVDQMAQDVAAFLTWTAEPKMIQRKQTGWFVLAFLIFATGLAYLSYKQVWAGKKPKKK
ncbi:cytochrome c1 [Erythrobacter sp. THAF29]|uniref:cytochrome c1 n=1 Tax=Erythrobacter sp. THAF29 TaxID=2587851 RepID=UPI001267DABC|nr:cytochrome c1 [Erythrobacter sp. THAF29]QFT76209.1 Cytochrome c1 precursor [Erythrobacter sp. THAF29]